MFHLRKNCENRTSIDPEIIWLHLKREEINEGKIYSPVGSLPSGLSK